MRWHTEECYLQAAEYAWPPNCVCADKWREFIAQLRRRIQVNNREATPSAARVNGALLWVIDALEVEED